ncbi:hypothetical protein RDI58_017510 [Solanum bulbocastanum]|uniref:Uncharacterized protein n=1 Tax=Solanum bulbocastanum TaxID=147425 RepID=A0AAN8THV5_SOLBU
MDDAPLFSNGITQIMSSNTNRIVFYDYQKIDWAENRSKKLHNPLVMAKVNIKKVKKDSQSSSKAQSIKPQKRGVEKSHQQFLDVLYLRSFCKTSLLQREECNCSISHNKQEW